MHWTEPRAIFVPDGVGGSSLTLLLEGVQRCPQPGNATSQSRSSENDVKTSNGKTILGAGKRDSPSKPRKVYGGLKIDQARKFKKMEAENARLIRLVAVLSLRETMLKEVVKGNY